MAEPSLPADEIADHLGVIKDTVHTSIAEMAMPAHKVGRLRKFRASEIDDRARAAGATSDHKATQQVPPMSVVAPTVVTTTGTGKGDDDAE